MFRSYYGHIQADQSYNHVYILFRDNMFRSYYGHIQADQSYNHVYILQLYKIVW